jgi:hypothetical protein
MFIEMAEAELAELAEAEFFTIFWDESTQIFKSKS